MYGDYTSLCPLIQVAEATSTPHLTWTDAPLPSEGLARAHRHLGKAPSRIERLAAVIVEGGDLALEAARPGVTCAEVEAVWQRVLNRHGYRKESRVGYSIGLGFPPDWGERTASLRPGDTTVLEAGMCFHFQSGMWLDDFGAAISESFVVTESAGERLCAVDRGLFVVARALAPSPVPWYRRVPASGADSMSAGTPTVISRSGIAAWRRSVPRRRSRPGARYWR